MKNLITKRKVTLSLGSNLGDREKYIERACTRLSILGKITEISSIYESKAWGMRNNTPPFLNQVIVMKTSFPVLYLLRQIKEIEQELGRRQKSIGEREGYLSREIDIDILFVNDYKCNTKILTIPHRGIYIRNFLLVPLLELGVR